MNFLSAQPFVYKKSVVNNLAQRIIHLTDTEFQNEVMEKGKRLLIENCYPPSLIIREFSRVLITIKIKQTVPHKQRNLDFGNIISLPFVPFSCECLASILRSYGFPLAHKQHNNLNFLMSTLKSKLKDEQVPGVVYNIKCA